MYCPPIIREPLMIHMLPMEKKNSAELPFYRCEPYRFPVSDPDETGMEKDCNILEWVAFASNAFNVLVPFYATIDTTPDYFPAPPGK